MNAPEQIDANAAARLAFFHRRLLPLAHGAACVGIALFLAAIGMWFWLKATPLAGPLNWCFDHYCHRIPDRSLMPFGETLPVCARCTGVVAGYLLGAMVALCGGEKLFFWRLPWALFFIALMGVSWLAGALDIVPAAWGWERLTTGMLGGFGGYIFFARAGVLVFDWWLERGPQSQFIRRG